MEKWLKFGITNFFTALRAAGIFCMIPVFKAYGGLATALLSVGCFITDFIDGKLARGLKSSTFFGSLFDGISDKAFLIVNFILLLSITPLAIIPILAELGIAGVQSLKYESNLNVQSNIIGKVKMWVAGITMGAVYLLVDPTFLNYLGADLATKISSMDKNALFGAVLTPLVLNEIATLGSYIKEFVDGQKEQEKEIPEESKEEKSEKEDVLVKEEEPTTENTHSLKNSEVEKYMENLSVKDMLFDHDFYEQHKDDGNLKLLRNLAKKKK